MPPDVRVYSLGAGDVREQMDEWPETGRKSVVASLKKQVGGEGGYALKDLEPTCFPAAERTPQPRPSPRLRGRG